MAAIPVTLNGTFTTDTGSAVGVFQGTMAYSGLGVGGGPVFPPERPVDPGYGIPGPPYPPIDAHPEHPIVLPPDPPTEPPTEPPTNPPSPQWVWGYNPTVKAWVRVYVPGEGEAGPKA